MDSPAKHSGRSSQKQCNLISSSAQNHPSCRRTHSSSSLSSCSSLGSSIFPNDSPSRSSPATPLRFSGRVPFSWEHLPGIPKKLQNHHKRTESLKVLPLLPPPATSTAHTSKKHNSNDKKLSGEESFREDPFFAALMECSKDHNDQERSFWTGAKVSRSISDRFGVINLYTSCRKTSAVSESLVYLPRSGKAASYGLINRRSR